MKILRPTVYLLLFLSLVSSCRNEGNKKGQAPTPGTTNTIVIKKPDVVEPHALFDTLHDGEFTLRYPSGVIQIKGFYAGGKREGEWIAFFPSGKTQSEGFFTQGKRDHRAIVYYENGKMMYEGTYTNGIMTGIWKYYNSDGSLNKEINYGNSHPDK